MQTAETLNPAEYPGSIERAAGRDVSVGAGREMVARGGVEPPTFRFSVGRSYQLSYLAVVAPRIRGAREHLTGAFRAGRNRRLHDGRHTVRRSDARTVESVRRPSAPYAGRAQAHGPPSSSGLGRRPFTAVARVRIPLGVRGRIGALASGNAGRGLCAVSGRIGLGQCWGNRRKRMEHRPSSRRCSTR